MPQTCASTSVLAPEVAQVAQQDGPDNGWCPATKPVLPQRIVAFPLQCHQQSEGTEHSRGGADGDMAARMQPRVNPFPAAPATRMLSHPSPMPSSPPRTNPKRAEDKIVEQMAAIGVKRERGQRMAQKRALRGSAPRRAVVTTSHYRRRYLDASGYSEG